MERLAEIIKILSGSKGFVSINDLAQDLEVTPRTIRSDILLLEQALESSQIRLLKRRNQGIALDKQTLSEKAVLNLLSQINGEKDFYSAPERENLIMEAFLLGNAADSWQEAFRLAGSLLCQEGYIEKRYIDCMIANAQTYGGYMIICDLVALPHAKATDGVNKTGFSFVTLNKSVVFEHDQERRPIRFVAALSADSSMMHLTAMGEFIELVCQEEKLRQLLEITDIDAFIHFIETTVPAV